MRKIISLLVAILIVSTMFNVTNAATSSTSSTHYKQVDDRSIDLENFTISIPQEIKISEKNRDKAVTERAKKAIIRVIDTCNETKARMQDKYLNFCVSFEDPFDRWIEQGRESHEIHITFLTNILNKYVGKNTTVNDMISFMEKKVQKGEMTPQDFEIVKGMLLYYSNAPASAPQNITLFSQNKNEKKYDRAKEAIMRVINNCNETKAKMQDKYITLSDTFEEPFDLWIDQGSESHHIHITWLTNILKKYIGENATIDDIIKHMEKKVQNGQMTAQEFEQIKGMLLYHNC